MNDVSTNREHRRQQLQDDVTRHRVTAAALAGLAAHIANEPVPVEAWREDWASVARTLTAMSKEALRTAEHIAQRLHDVTAAAEAHARWIPKRGES